MNKENNEEEDKKLESREENMALKLWHRVILGSAGGMLIGGSLVSSSILPNEFKFTIPIAGVLAGIAAIYYARHGGW